MILKPNENIYYPDKHQEVGTVVGKETRIVPTGELSITENGTFNVYNYATVAVAVEGGGSSGDYSYSTIRLTNTGSVSGGVLLMCPELDEENFEGTAFIKTSTGLANNSGIVLGANETEEVEVLIFDGGYVEFSVMDDVVVTGDATYEYDEESRLYVVTVTGSCTVSADIVRLL